jgi:hypothetical protein
MEEVKQQRTSTKMKTVNPSKCPWINVQRESIGLPCNKNVFMGKYCGTHTACNPGKQDPQFLIDLLQEDINDPQKKALRLQRLEDLFDSGRLQRPNSRRQTLMVVDEDEEDEGDLSEDEESSEDEDGSQLVQMFQSKISVAPTEAQQLQKVFDSFLLKINTILDANNIHNLSSRSAYRKIIFNQHLLNETNYSHYITNGKLPKK